MRVCEMNTDNKRKRSGDRGWRLRGTRLRSRISQGAGSTRQADVRGLTTNRAFIKLASNYFGRSWPVQVLDRSDEGGIEWSDVVKSANAIAPHAVKTARRILRNSYQSLGAI
jgi:hypothetical protein